jgi:hypothetical protein
MALRIMVLDVFKLGRVLEGWVVPVQMSEPLVEMRVAGANVAYVAFEVLDVDGVEADQGCVEADVCFGYRRGGEKIGR